MLLVDGHPVTREVFGELIRDRMGDTVELIATDRAADAAERAIPLHEAVRLLVEAQPGLPVMVMTGVPDDEEVPLLIEAGTCLVWDKSAGEEAFWEAVRKCLQPEAGPVPAEE